MSTYKTKWSTGDKTVLALFTFRMFSQFFLLHLVFSMSRITCIYIAHNLNECPKITELSVEEIKSLIPSIGSSPTSLAAHTNQSSWGRKHLWRPSSPTLCSSSTSCSRLLRSQSNCFLEHLSPRMETPQLLQATLSSVWSHSQKWFFFLILWQNNQPDYNTHPKAAQETVDFFPPAGAHCWLMFGLVSTRKPTFFLQSYFPDSLSAVCKLAEGVPLCHIIQANNKDANPYWLKVNFTVSDDYRKESTRQCEQVNDWTEQNIKFNEFWAFNLNGQDNSSFLLQDSHLLPEYHLREIFH